MLLVCFITVNYLAAGQRCSSRVIDNDVVQVASSPKVMSGSREYNVLGALQVACGVRGVVRAKYE